MKLSQVSALVAFSLITASNFYASSAWSDAQTVCENQCSLQSGKDREACKSRCYSSYDYGRTGGCGLMPTGPVGRMAIVGGLVQPGFRATLSPEQTIKVRQIVNACLVVPKVDRTPTSLHVAQAQIRPGCQNYIRYSERGSVAYGALNLGNEILQMKITTRDGRDGDQNEVEFAEGSKIIASYGRTDDSIENGLALLKAMF